MDHKVRFLVIPAAGLGTRMKPINSVLPKEMLPIGPKPAIQYAVEEGIDAQIAEIVIVIRRDKESIREHLAQLSCPLTFLYQEEARGEADAIALAERVVGDSPVAILYPDNLYLPAPGALRLLSQAFARRRQDVLGLTQVTSETARVMGNSGRVDVSAIDGDVYRIRQLLPKGAGHFRLRYPMELRACGIMVCGPHLFPTIRRARTTVSAGEFTDEPVRALLLRESGLLGVHLPGTLFDVGNPEGYRQCIAHFQSHCAQTGRSP